MYPLTAVSSAQTVAGYHHRAQLAQSQSRCSEMNIVSSLQMLCRGGAHWLTAKKKKKVCLLWPSSPTRVNPSPTDIYGHVVTCTHTCLHTTRLHGDSPALPHAILMCCAAAVSHLLAVKHQGIFKTDFTGIIWLQPWRRQQRSEGRKEGRGEYIRPHENSVSPSYLSQRRKTPLRCSYWAQKVTMRYSEVMFPPPACPCSPASLQASQTAKQTTCNSTDSLTTSVAAGCRG